MKYQFKVKKCENCQLDLTGVEPEDVGERGGELTGYCPRCYVAYPVVEVSSRRTSEPEPKTPPPSDD